MSPSQRLSRASRGARISRIGISQASSRIARSNVAMRGQMPVQLFDQIRPRAQARRRSRRPRPDVFAALQVDRAGRRGRSRPCPASLRIAAFAPDRVLDLDRNDPPDVFAIGRGDRTEGRPCRIFGRSASAPVSRRILRSSMLRSWSPPKVSRPILGVGADARDLAGLIGGDDELPSLPPIACHPVTPSA